MELLLFQKGFNFSQDGPGNRLVYHLQGCNLRCPWCANPEGLQPGGCLLQTGPPAESACPRGAVRGDTLDRAVCALCQTHDCTQTPGSALEWSAKRVPLEEILKECLDCRPMYFSGGGVTLTGGEATVQFDAVKALLTQLKKNGIHTALESNGHHPALPELFPLVDYLILDCKHYDDAVHKRFTGVGNSLILQNIRAALSRRGQLLIRVPLIGGFNAGEADAQGFAALFADMNLANAQIELLRYHEYGKHKWKQCGLSYTMKQGEVSPETLRQFVQLFRQKNLPIVHT